MSYILIGQGLVNVAIKGISKKERNRYYDALEKADDFDRGLASYQARRKERVTKVVDTASKNAWKYHLSNGPLRMAAHMGIRMASTLAPKTMMGQFDWIYLHDVTKE